MIYTHTLDPVIFHLGPLQLRWYGLMYVIGFVGAYFLLRKFSKEGSFKLSFIQIESLLFYAFVGLFVGARFFYVFIYNFSYYIHHLIEIVAIWKGLAGLSFHGGMIGVVIAAILFSRKHKIPFWHLGDHFVLCAPIGLGFGRVGNFINGELFGRSTSGNWGVIFPEGGLIPRHPSQLYESFFEGAVLFSLLLFFRKRVREGQLSALFLIFYGIFRFALEYFREPDPQLGFIFLNFSMGQLLCFLMILCGSGLLLYFHPALKRSFFK
ncbi:MAG: prolipoprotein diacylglyceryl transferase [Deltaproteobacteria bacterium]|nr:prolipoprotein diacylglyceryl transferase [Deltaproteobacteria bacterium]MBI3017635.1 prolipoprotein diacylglyceryl transferase [Deltaproteobacteria bacterium]